MSFKLCVTRIEPLVVNHFCKRCIRLPLARVWQEFSNKHVLTDEDLFNEIIKITIDNDNPHTKNKNIQSGYRN